MLVTWKFPNKPEISLNQFLKQKSKIFSQNSLKSIMTPNFSKYPSYTLLEVGLTPTNVAVK